MSPDAAKLVGMPTASVGMRRQRGQEGLNAAVKVATVDMEYTHCARSLLASLSPASEKPESVLSCSHSSPASPE